MVEYLIGNFMVESGLMTKDEFDRVLEIQDKVRVKLGLLAVEEGLMTVKQADEVNFLQTVQDKRFGDIAVEKGFLTEDQVTMLLNKQGNEYLSFVQTLVDEGIIGIGEMDAVIHGYQIENGFSDEQIEAVKKADMESIVRMMIPEEASRYIQHALLAVKMVIRTIDRHAYIGKAELADTFDAVMPVTQKLEGENGFDTAISEGRDGMCKAASIFGRLELSELDEDVQDACGEILNCLNGMYVSMLSREDVELELLPPILCESHTFQNDEIFVLPIYMGNEQFNFIITDNEWR